ncbi:MAG: c-type cytochrome [Proteobacteria bacterium]|nr:c-type cytochrome [Pseudomonadota bacterium]
MISHRSAAGMLLLASALLGASALSAPAAERPGRAQASLAKGKEIYARECAACHGVKGDGEGPGAHIVNPKPRNFILGVFKLRTTPSGQPPTDDDLLRTITQGIAHSAMPSFRELPEADRRALVGVVRQFADIKTAPRPIAIPAAPEVSAALLEKGKTVYTALKCQTCHGDTGTGDGASSLTLKDDAKGRIWAPDLTTGVFKSGDDAKALYARIATGLDGTPMPSYASQAKPDEIWAVVHYVRSLAKR